MSFIKVNIHFVWSIKERKPFFAAKEIRQIVWQHIRENANRYKKYQEEYDEFIKKYGFKKFG
jgi:hypothetical protein